MPVVGVVDVPAFLLVGPTVKETNAKDFIAMARKSNEKLNYTSAGAGSTLHLAAEWFKSNVGFKAQHVPQRGSGPAVTSLAGGEVDFSFENLGPAQPQMDAGRVRMLAIAAPKRFPTLPNVPTLKEAGLPDTDMSSWFVLMAPTGTPAPVIQTLNSEVNKRWQNLRSETGSSSSGSFRWAARPTNSLRACSKTPANGARSFALPT